MKLLVPLIIVVVAILLYYYYIVVKKYVIKKVRLYKPASLADTLVGDEKTFQVAQVVLSVDGGSKLLSASDLVISSSSTCSYGYNTIPFDGNTSNQNHPHVFHSCAVDREQFLEAELINPQELHSITIYNRKDCCSNRLNGVMLQLVGEDNSILKEVKLTGDLITELKVTDILKS